MLEFSTVSFLLLVGIGAFVQTVSGFALGLVIILGATILEIEHITFSAAVISVISLVNSSVALRTSYKSIHLHFFYYICWALMLGLVIGVTSLNRLSGEGYSALRILLGSLVIVAGVLLLLRSIPRASPSGKWATFLFGFTGGIVGGLFSTGGSVWAYFLYQQPLRLEVIRATLLAVLAFSSFTRTMMVIIAGQMTMNVVVTGLVAIPIVVIVTELTSRNLNSIPVVLVQRLVVSLMSLAGLFLIFG